jgi:hypothetical protein
MAVPLAAWARSANGGFVRNGSAATLRGVTVEAASPALIKTSRRVVTDGQGQYKIVRPPPSSGAKA